ncbi:surface protein [Elysia marginata]|uniref:Surface protein n=1 Tax=Elysia marginata TaxID=1093978 RepID=A0AAV4G529_9GAST|nr:surface protein [Elysia marginata]
MKTIKATDGNIEDIVKYEIARLGYHADLNHIDVSEVMDMRGLFRGSNFNGDISKWNVSSVIDMSEMFQDAKFNGNISNWDVSNCLSFELMFYNSDFKPVFTGDISKWKVRDDANVKRMFNADAPNSTPKIRIHMACDILHELTINYGSELREFAKERGIIKD